jgi:hypothetical protein
VRSFTISSFTWVALAAAPILILIVPVAAQNAIELRSLAKRDCGLNLKITGGFGGSANDPIIVTSLDPVEAASTEMLALRCIGKGRGILWRTLARTMSEVGGKWLMQVKIETKAINGTEIVKQRENYYFDVAAADPGHKGLPPAPGFIDPKTGLKLAYEVGWLHLDGVTNNEAENPGLGYSVAYAAPGLKVTVFVYDRGNAVIPSELDAKIAKSEFNSAVSDMLTVIPKYLPLGPVTSNGVMLRPRL